MSIPPAFANALAKARSVEKPKPPISEGAGRSATYRAESACDSREWYMTLPL
jgi:hypothetical protein